MNVQIRPSGRNSAFITALGIAQIASWGTLFYSFPLIALALEDDLAWSKAAIYGAWTIGILLSALLAMPVGKAIDRGYGRYVMGGASVLASGLLVLWSAVDSLPLYYFAAAGVGALQAATLYEPAFAVIARRTGPQAARNGITAITLWGGFASTVFVPLVQGLIELLGWRGTLQTLACINLLICATIYLIAINPRLDAVDTVHAGSTDKRAPLDLALRNPVFWWLAVSFTAYAACASAFLLHVYPLLQERGFSASSIVTIIALIGPAQVVGRMVVLSFAKGLSGRRLGSLTMLAFPAALAVVAWGPAEMVLISGAALLFGAANGVITIVRGIIVPELVSREAYGSINGALLVPVTIARALAPLGAAALWQGAGNYDDAMMVMVGLSIVMAASFWLAAATFARKGGS